jgi:hypothetical protein
MFKSMKRWLEWAFWGLAGAYLLYLAGALVFTEYSLGKYEKIFNRLEHPQWTSLVDKVSLQYRYYPATYVDDSIHFTSASLVGELRTYNIDWDEIKDFYNNRRLENGNPIAVMPIEVRKNDERTWLSATAWFRISPGHHDILEGIREQYDFWGWPERLNGGTQKFYLVYVLGQ